MEYRGSTERNRQPAAEPSTGPQSAGVLRRQPAERQRDELPNCGSLQRRAQHPGGDPGRKWPADDSKHAEPVLCATKFNSDESLAKHKNPKTKSTKHPDGGPGNSGGSQNILDSLSTAVILLDENLLISSLNPAAENLLGVSSARANHQPLLPLVDDDDELGEVLIRVLQTGVTYANEIRLGPTEVHTEHRVVDCRVSVLTTPDINAPLLVEMTDVTRRSRINREQALLIQHGAGRQMVRQLAHEIKNPLGGLRGAAQLLDRQLDSDELHEYTSVIISEADRLAALVDTLLGPGGPPNKKPLNIHELIEYVVRIIQPDLGHGLKITRDYDPGLPEINLDRDQVVQALLNVIQNAAAALEGHGNIVLRSRAILNFTIGDSRHRVVASIEIEDDGPGIPQDLQDSIFYPLVTSRPEGTGLGLPAAQELISRHDGLIEFESRPGRTTFYLRIPLTPTESDDHA